MVMSRSLQFFVAVLDNECNLTNINTHVHIHIFE